MLFLKSYWAIRREIWKLNDQIGKKLCDNLPSGERTLEDRTNMIVAIALKTAISQVVDKYKLNNEEINNILHGDRWWKFKLVTITKKGG